MKYSSSRSWPEHGLRWALFCVLILQIGWVAFIFHAEYLERPAPSEIETMVFSTGEILKNTSSGIPGRLDLRHNLLTLQETSSSPEERIADVLTQTAAPGSNPGTVLQGQPPQVKTAKLLRSDHFPLAIVLNDYLFIRHPSSANPNWSEFNLATETSVKKFLDAAPGGISDVGRKPRYEFDHLDLSNGLLVTKNTFPDSLLPQYLVYSTDSFRSNRAQSAPQAGIFWHFDLERTRELDGLPVPPDPALTLKVFYHAPPGQSVNIPYLESLKDNVDQSIPLSSTEWRRIDYSSAAPGVDPQKAHLEVRFGFKDADPGEYTICFRGLDDYTPPNLSSKIGEWFGILSPPGWVQGSLNYKIEAANK